MEAKVAKHTEKLIQKVKNHVHSKPTFECKFYNAIPLAITSLIGEVKEKKKAWACKHKSSLHYGKGKCTNCYHLEYYHKKRQEANLASKKQKPKQETDDKQEE